MVRERGRRKEGHMGGREGQGRGEMENAMRNNGGLRYFAIFYQLSRYFFQIQSFGIEEMELSWLQMLLNG